MVLLRLLPILSALLFTLLQKVDVRVTKRDRLTVKINFNLIAIVLSEDKNKNKRRNHFSRLMKNIPIILKSVNYLISKSNVVIKICKREKAETDPRSVFAVARTIALLQFVSSYLEENSKSFHFLNEDADQDGGYGSGKADFDASLHFSLIHLINSALFFLYYIIKNKANGVLKNV